MAAPSLAAALPRPIAPTPTLVSAPPPSSPCGPLSHPTLFTPRTAGGPPPRGRPAESLPASRMPALFLAPFARTPARHPTTAAAASTQCVVAINTDLLFTALFLTQRSPATAPPAPSCTACTSQMCGAAPRRACPTTCFVPPDLALYPLSLTACMASRPQGLPPGAGLQAAPKACYRTQKRCRESNGQQRGGDKGQ